MFSSVWLRLSTADPILSRSWRSLSPVESISVSPLPTSDLTLSVISRMFSSDFLTSLPACPPVMPLMSSVIESM